MTSIASPPGQDGAIAQELERILAIAWQRERNDLAARIQSAKERIARPETIVVVVGEFKQGKSSIVNALLGEQLCPVDDDIATAALTVVHHGEPGATVWRQLDSGLVGEAIPFERLIDFVSEAANPGNRAEVALIEVRLPNPLLARGIALVDTPGVGGLSAGYAGMTLGYLHTADALLFVTDASAPLSAAELEFLKQASERCSRLTLVLSKIDLFPDWRRIAEINREVLASNGIQAHIAPLSSALRNEAFLRRDAGLNVESGYPALLDLIATTILDPSRALAAARAHEEAVFVVDQLLAELVPQLTVLEDPSAAESTIQALESERARLERLRAGSARWQLLLNDQFADLVTDSEHRFRQRVRLLSRETDDSIESTDPADTWDETVGLVRDVVANAASGVIRELEAGCDAIAVNIVDLLKEEAIAIAPALGRAKPMDLGRLWSAARPAQQSVSETAGMGWASLRGAQGGMLVLGMMGSLAGIVLSTGMMVGIGALFGGKQIFEERRKQVTQRRQKARSAIRQFLDDVQFEVGKSMRDVSRELQRQLRDHFSERIAESVRTCASAADSLQKSLQQDESVRARRVTELRKDIEILSGAGARLADQPMGAP